MDLPLHTERLVLRMMREQDAPVFAAYRNDPDVARYQDWDLPVGLDDARRLIGDQSTLDRPTPGHWVQLAVEHEGVVVGDVAVHLDPDGRAATIGYTVAPPWQGRGIAGEAAAATIAALFGDGVERITAGVDPANLPSIRLLTRLGFTLVSQTERSLLVRGEWVDDATYELNASG